MCIQFSKLGYEERSMCITMLQGYCKTGVTFEFKMWECICIMSGT